MPAILYRDPRTGQTIPVQGAAAAPGVTDHGALTGLADDDHPQYLNNARVAWQPYTLTVKQGPSAVVAGTTNRARYALIGKTVHVAVHWTATATGTADFIQVGLPAGRFPAAYYDIGLALISNGTVHVSCTGLNNYNGDAVRLLRTDNGQYYATALAPNHVIYLNMTYEAA